MVYLRTQSEVLGSQSPHLRLQVRALTKHSLTGHQRSTVPGEARAAYKSAWDGNWEQWEQPG